MKRKLFFIPQVTNNAILSLFGFYLLTATLTYFIGGSGAIIFGNIPYNDFDLQSSSKEAIAA